MDYTAIIVACISLIGVVVSPIITANIAAKKQREENQKEQKERDKKQDRIFSKMIGGQLQEMCCRVVRDGYIEHETLKQIHDLYDEYKDLGGNGYIDSLLAKVDLLPLKN